MITRRVTFSRSPAAVSFQREGPSEKGLLASQEANVAADSKPHGVAGESSEVQPKQEVATTMQAILRALGELQSERRQLIGELRELAVELACAVASHVIGDLVGEGQFPLERLVDEAINELGVAETEEVKLRMHPDDYRVMKATWTEQAATDHLAARLNFVPDPTLPRGSCEAVCNERGMLMDVGDQLKQIRHELLNTI